MAQVRIRSNQLSGGQQQRVAIARALVNRPEIIFADEPTGNLDSKTSDEVIALLKMTAKKYGQTIVMITHDDENIHSYRLLFLWKALRHFRK